MSKPTAQQISSCLEVVVKEALANDEEVSINSVRSVVESRLDLEPDFLKTNAEWKVKSKGIIKSAVASIDQDEGSEPPTGRLKRKRDDALPSSHHDTLDAPGANKTVSRFAHHTSKVTDAVSLDDTNDGGSASDYSSVIDEPITRKQRGRDPKTTKSKSTKEEATNTAGAKQDLSQEEQEIKRLQGWLVKCGIRKLWHKELAGIGSDKAKIKHLNSMLADAGMSGRFSVEKAKRIKEARELASELQDTREFNDQWGADKVDDSEQDNPGDTSHLADISIAGRVHRRRPKGLIDFGDSEEGDDD